MLRSISVALVAMALVTLSGSPLRAQATDAAKLDEAKQRFVEGKTLYEKGDKPAAVEAFKLAYKLSKNPVVLYNIGFVYDELGDRTLALHYYEKFLVDAAGNEKAQANLPLAADRVKVIKAAIAAEEAALAAPPPEEKRPPPPPKRDRGKPATAADFLHECVAEAPPAKPLDITAKIPGNARWQLTLFHRAAGESDFQTTPMKQRYDEFVGRIPPASVRGTAIHYYIEVRSDSGELVTNSGRASSPNVIFVEPSAKPHFYEEAGEGGSGTMAATSDDELPDEDPSASDDSDDVGGPNDTPAGPLTYAKWGATGGVAAFLAATLVFYLSASDHASALSSVAYTSQNPAGNQCPTNGQPPPCLQFADQHRTVETDGETFEILANVSLVLGVTSAAAAGALWYLDAKQARAAALAGGERATRRGIRVSGAPIVGPGLVGGAAVIQF